MGANADAQKADRNAHVRPHIQRSKEFEKEFKFKEAITEWDFIIENGVDILLPEAYSHRGYLKYRALDYGGCIADCTRALAANPNLLQALYNRAAAYKEAGHDPDAALADLEHLLKIDPKDTLGLFLRAYLYGDTGQWERAAEAWLPYIELKPDDLWARLHRGNDLVQLGRKREAINEYLKGSEINPKFKGFYFKRWQLYRELGELDLAQKDYDAGMAIINEPSEMKPGDPRDPAVQRAQERLRKLKAMSFDELQERRRAW